MHPPPLVRIFQDFHFCPASISYHLAVTLGKISIDRSSVGIDAFRTEEKQHQWRTLRQVSLLDFHAGAGLHTHGVGSRKETLGLWRVI